MKKFILGVFIFAYAGFCFAVNTYRAHIDNAERNFKEGKFSKSIEIYESLIKVEKIEDPYIYYNLSNAYYRNGDVGKAILNIERALRLAPRDKEIKNNMQFLYSVIGHNQERTIKDIFLKHFTLNEITIVTSVLLIFFLCIESLFIIKKLPIFKHLIVVLTLFLFLCAFALSLKGCQEFMLKEAVVLYSVNVRSGPGENNPEISTVPEGKLVNIIFRSGDWVNIKFKSSGKSFAGWIRANDIGSVNE
ncbi:MAG: SH3 domain-containing protein [Endomicrobium sp.]|jgi:tetratricopeptide (TPR) repeat protein|nr:SH3 domain-containing protein [Endomicrobium sp.]